MSRRDPRTEVGTMRTRGCCIDVGIPIPKTLVINPSDRESGCPKRRDAHITVTEGLSHFISVPCFPALSVYGFLAARSSLIAYQIVV